MAIVSFGSQPDSNRVNPDIGLTTLALLVGIGRIVRGTIEIFLGLSLRGLRGAAP